ncbi:6-bladed beta-propeller [bacterium]|nr:6-bladed beta-propeller [bacterium]
MKLKSTLSALSVLLFLFVLCPVPSQSIEEPVLELLQRKGISEEVGSFRYINAPYFTERNYFKQGMAFDSEGNLYVTDSGDGQIEVFDKNLKPVRHFGNLGNGDGQFQYLTDVKVDRNEIFTLDILLNRIQVFDLEGRFLYSFETGLPTEEYVSYPLGFAISLHENIFVADRLYGIKVFDRKGKFIRAIDSELMLGDDGLGNEMLMLEDMKSDENGNIYILINFSGDGSPLILLLNPEGSFLSEEPFESAIFVSQYLTPNGCFAFEGDYFYALLWDSYGGANPFDGNLLSSFRMKYQIDSTVTVDYETIDMIFNYDYLSKPVLPINNPTAFLVRDEILYILDSYQNKIVRMNLQGELIDVYESPSQSHEILQGIYGDNQGTIFTANMTKSCIEVRNEKLEVVETLGKPGIPGLLPDLGEFNCPYAMLIDPKGYLYCSDFNNGCVQIFGPDKQPFMTFYPLDHLETPAGLYLDRSGNLVLLDKEACSVFLFDISRIEKKEIKLIKTIKWESDYKRVVHSLAITEKNNYLIPLRDGEGILAEMGDNGKIKRKWADQLKTKKEEPFLLPRAVWQDAQRNYLLLDEWRGYVWKFNAEMKISWIENLNWFGIREVWESNEGILYALDKAHDAILVFRDKSFDSEDSVSLNLKSIPEVTYEEKITLSGTTDKGSTVRIDKETVIIDEDGNFEKEMPLQIGENKWIIEATHPTKKPVTKELKTIRKEKVIIRMQVNSTAILINDLKKVLEAPPFLDKKVNRVYAPIRVVVEAIVGTVEWVATEQKVIIHKGNTELILVVDVPYALLNGKKILIDPVNEFEKLNPVVPRIVNGRVFLPLRFIGENLGFLVEWEAKTQGIVLTYPDPNRSNITSFSVNRIGQSFGKVISYSLQDNYCTVFPLEHEEVIVFIPSLYNGTGIVKMDASGKILDLENQG